MELDAIDRTGGLTAGDIRFRLVQHLLSEGQKRGAARFHVACADEAVTSSCSCRPASRATARSASSTARRTSRCRSRGPTSGRDSRADPPGRPVDALALMQLYRAVTPAPVARLEDYRLSDWERQGSHWRVPRSSLTPILRFADVEAFVQDGADGGPDRRLLPDRRGQGGPAALPARDVPPRPRPERPDRFGLGAIAAQSGKNGSGRPNHGVLSAVRTYESPLDRRLEESGFAEIATVSLLMKETLVRVAEPALVPAAVRPWEVTRGS